jgi:hypothetical protein
VVVVVRILATLAATRREFPEVVVIDGTLMYETELVEELDPDEAVMGFEELKPVTFTASAFQTGTSVFCVIWQT